MPARSLPISEFNEDSTPIAQNQRLWTDIFDFKPADMAVISIDLEGLITEVNAPALVALGHDKACVIGKHYAHFMVLSHLNLDLPENADLESQTPSYLSAGEPHFSVYGLLHASDHKSLKPIEICVAPLYRAGVITGTALIIDGKDFVTSGRSGLQY